ncbi:antirestriction protein ArdC [Amorphus sp. MBR-141]
MPLKTRFGSEAYAAEELVAELGAAFLCADLDISLEPRPDHASYVATWLKVLKNDTRAIFTAASKAQQAVQFLQGLGWGARQRLSNQFDRPILSAGDASASSRLGAKTDLND